MDGPDGGVTAGGAGTKVAVAGQIVVVVMISLVTLPTGQLVTVGAHEVTV